MEYPFLLAVTLAGGEVYRLVYAVDYDAACTKAIAEFGNTEIEIRNATIQ